MISNLALAAALAAKAHPPPDLDDTDRAVWLRQATDLTHHLTRVLRALRPDPTDPDQRRLCLAVDIATGRLNSAHQQLTAAADQTASN